jgi:hypothetical protein
MNKLVLQLGAIAFIIVLISFPLTVSFNVLMMGTQGLQNAPIPPSLTLLAGGAKWAAGQNGNSTLFIDWEDNYLAHGTTDGINWTWPSETDMINDTDSIAYALNQSGLDVHLAGDLPDSLAGYNLLVISAYYAVEPKDLAMVQDFIANGGGVVLLSGVPEYFRTYCKTFSPGELTLNSVCATPVSSEKADRESVMLSTGFGGPRTEKLTGTNCTPAPLYVTFA